MIRTPKFRLTDRGLPDPKQVEAWRRLNQVYMREARSAFDLEGRDAIRYAGDHTARKAWAARVEGMVEALIRDGLADGSDAELRRIVFAQTTEAPPAEQEAVRPQPKRRKRIDVDSDDVDFQLQ